jgi:hypothetical protein
MRACASKKKVDLILAQSAWVGIRCEKISILYDRHKAADGPPTKYFGEPDHAATGGVAVLAHHRFIRDLVPVTLEAYPIVVV